MVAPQSRSNIGNIRVFEADLPGACCGTLVFGVGMRDESPTHSGITHLMEHLLLRLVEPITVEHGAVVDAHSLTVYASGSSDEVSQFFIDVTRAIARFGDITEQDLMFEKQIIRIEHPTNFDQPNAGLLTYRYGLSGVGLANFGAPATISMTRREVIDWAARWLRDGNTSISFSQPLPATLKPVLPHGQITRTEQRTPLLQTPALIASAKGGVALSLLASRHGVDLLKVALRHELHMSLRHERGLIYGLETFTTPIDKDISELVLVLDPEQNNIDTTVRVVANTLKKIEIAGFSAAAVDSARIHGWAEAGRTFSGLDYLDRLAEDDLRGWPTKSPNQVRDDAAAASSVGLTRLFIESASSLIVAYDQEVSLKKKTLMELGLRVTRFTPWQPVGSYASTPVPKTAEGKWRSKHSNDTLLVGHEALFKIAGAGTRQIAFKDIALVGDRACGCLTLVDYQGRSVEFQTDDWKRLKSLKTLLLGVFDPAIVRQFPKH
jgi:predicted Zn-dependent peptidase